MNKATIQTIIGFGVGAILGFAVAMFVGVENTTEVQPKQAHDNNSAPVVVGGHSSGDGMSMNMNDMVKALEGKQGNDFDRAFIELMIPHHEGAVLMAELAKKSALHPEVKGLADAIIRAQNEEITKMRMWYDEWGGEIKQ